jgi:hypothetical protein
MIEKKEDKLFLFSDDVIVSKDSTKRLSDLMNMFTKVAGFKINVQKPVAFLYK